MDSSNAWASEKPAVSIVIPVYNEEESLPELRDELMPVLDSLGEPFEVLFVDDGSRDKSPEILRRFYEEDPRVRVIRFARNFGQQMANTAALHHARGRAVIIMEADLQTPAKYIPHLLAKLREGYDIVYGKRESGRVPLYRRIGTIAANYLINVTTGVRLPDAASGFVALDERLVQTVNRYNERSRYLSGLFAWLSYGRCSWVPVARRERQHGRSKYNVVQLVRLVLNLITSWSTRPLHLALGAGAFVMGIGGLVGLYWLYLVATHGWSAGGLVLLAAALILLAGVQLLAMGIIGDYIGKIYNEVRERPQYVIADIYQREKEHDA